MWRQTEYNKSLCFHTRCTATDFSRLFLDIYISLIFILYLCHFGVSKYTDYNISKLSFVVTSGIFYNLSMIVVKAERKLYPEPQNLRTSRAYLSSSVLIKRDFQERRKHLRYVKQDV